MTDLNEKLTKLDKTIAARPAEKLNLLTYDDFLELQAKVVANPDLARKELGETCLDALNIIAKRIKYKYSIPLLPGEEPTFNTSDARMLKEMLDVTEYTGRKAEPPPSQINIKQLTVNVQKSAQELENVLKDVIDI